LNIMFVAIFVIKLLHLIDTTDKFKMDQSNKTQSAKDTYCLA